MSGPPDPPSTSTASAPSPRHPQEQCARRLRPPAARGARVPDLPSTRCLGSSAGGPARVTPPTSAASAARKPSLGPRRAGAQGWASPVSRPDGEGFVSGLALNGAAWSRF